MTDRHTQLVVLVVLALAVVSTAACGMTLRELGNGVLDFELPSVRAVVTAIVTLIGFFVIGGILVAVLGATGQTKVGFYGALIFIVILVIAFLVSLILYPREDNPLSRFGNDLTGTPTSRSRTATPTETPSEPSVVATATAPTEEPETPTVSRLGDFHASENWSKIREGMSPEHVIAWLGEPTRREDEVNSDLHYLNSYAFRYEGQSSDYGRLQGVVIFGSRNEVTIVGPPSFIPLPR